MKFNNAIQLPSLNNFDLWELTSILEKFYIYLEIYIPKFNLVYSVIKMISSN